MGYFVSWIVDGDDLCSNAGWAAFAQWAAGLKDAPALSALAEKGTVGADSFAQLERELKHNLDASPPDVAHVGKLLLAELHNAPDGAAALTITDGVEGEESGDANP